MKTKNYKILSYEERNKFILATGPYNCVVAKKDDIYPNLSEDIEFCGIVMGTPVYVSTPKYSNITAKELLEWCEEQRRLLWVKQQ